MTKLIKGFQQFINENFGHESGTIEIDMTKKRPEKYGRDSRLSGDEDDAEYTHDIKTTIKAEQVESADQAQGSVHPSFETSPVKVKITYSDSEGGFGTYGPYGGGWEVTVFAGVDEFTEEAILHLADQLWEEGEFAA